MQKYKLTRMIQTSVSEWKNLLPWLSSLLLMLYLPLNPSLPISCRTSFLFWLTLRKHGLEHLSEQHDAWHQISQSRCGTPWRGLLLALPGQPTPWRPTTTPSTRWYPASTHLYGSSWTPWGTSRLSQPTQCNASREVASSDRNQLKLPGTPATLEQIVPEQIVPEQIVPYPI